MINLLTDMLNAQETPEQWEAFTSATAFIATIENNQQAAQEGFEDATY